MANTSVIYARIDTELKENAEKILSRLGISRSGMIQMLYSQIVLNNGIPFDVKLPTQKPIAAGALTQEQLDEELAKGIKSIKADKTYSADEADAELNKRFAI